MGQFCTVGRGFRRAMIHAPDVLAYRQARAVYLAFGLASISLLSGEFDQEIANDASNECDAIGSGILNRRLRRIIWAANPAHAAWPGMIACTTGVMGYWAFRDGKHCDAIDWFGIVATSPHPDHDSRLRAMELRARSANVAGLHFFAETAYREMERAAIQWSDVPRAIAAKLGRALTHLQTKDYAAAQPLLLDTLAAAERNEERELAAKARANLGVLLGELGEHRAAYAFSAEAIDDLPSDDAKNRARLNLAESMVHLDRRDESRDLLTWLATYATEAAIRQEAMDALRRHGLNRPALERATPSELSRLAPLRAALAKVF